MGVPWGHKSPYVWNTSDQIDKEGSVNMTYTGGTRVVSFKGEPTPSENHVSFVDTCNSKDEKEIWNMRGLKDLTVQENNQLMMEDYKNQANRHNPYAKYKIRGATATYIVKEWVQMKRGVEIEDILCKIMKEGKSCNEPMIPAFKREINKVDQGELQSGARKSTVWSVQSAQEHGWSAPEGEPLAISLTKYGRRTDEMEASKDRQTDDGTQMSPRKLQEECGKLKRTEEEGNEMKPGEQIRNRITTK